MRPEPVRPGLRLDQGTLTALVHLGVGLFGERRLSEPDPLFQALQEEYDPARTMGLPPRAWPELIACLPRQGRGWQGPVGRLARELTLGPADLFVLGLCGGTESSHWLNLAIGTLQAPDGPARPTLHLVSSLVAQLFEQRLAPHQLAQHALVRSGVLTLEDDDSPMPLRTLGTSPLLWALLGGEEVHWPGTEFLPPPQPDLLPASLSGQLPRAARLLAEGAARGVVLRGARESGLCAAALLAEALGRRALTVGAEQWAAEAALSPAARYGGWLPVLSLELGPSDCLCPPQRPLPPPLVVVTGREGAVDGEGWMEIELPPLDRAQRQRLWHALLGDTLDTHRLADGAVLEGPLIQRLAARARLDAERQDRPLTMDHITAARMRLGTHRLRLLAQPVERQVARQALILPPALAQDFEQLVQRCQRREALWQGLGATLKASATAGIRALFSGESGTGKTLAASHLATRLGAPLYRLDLAAVLNKYIGETEKNLGLLLDTAAASDVILLLDEADALFGRRSAGEGSGDRFANMLTNFLLTRIETHPGIIVLTSNARARIDPAFTRRLDIVLDFPRPAFEERLALWHSHLGRRAPGPDACRLLASYCELSGGHIRNAVLHAAALVPGEGPLPLATLVAGLRAEYHKLGSGMPAALDQMGAA